MNQTMGVSRRRFLYVFGAAGSATVLGAVLVRWRGRERSLAAAVTVVLGNLAAAREIGALWVAANPHQSRPADLVDGLLVDLGRQARSAGPEEIHRLVAERIRSDYATGRVGQIAGWVLSRTEIRLCALAAVTAPAGTAAVQAGGTAP